MMPVIDGTLTGGSGGNMVTILWSEPWFAVLLTCVSIVCLSLLVVLCACIEHKQKGPINSNGSTSHGGGVLQVLHVQQHCNGHGNGILHNGKEVQHFTPCTTSSNGQLSCSVQNGHSHHSCSMMKSMNGQLQQHIVANNNGFCHHLLQMGPCVTSMPVSSVPSVPRYETQMSKNSVKSSQEGRELPPVPSVNSNMECVAPKKPPRVAPQTSHTDAPIYQNSGSDPYQNACDSVITALPPISTAVTAPQCQRTFDSICTIDSDLNSDADPLYSTIRKKSGGSQLGSPQSSAQSTPSRDHYSRVRIQPLDSSQSNQLRRICGSQPLATSVSAAAAASVSGSLLVANTLYSKVRRRREQDGDEDEEEDEFDVSFPPVQQTQQCPVATVTDSYASIPPLPVRGYGQSEVDLLESMRTDQFTSEPDDTCNSPRTDESSDVHDTGECTGTQSTDHEPPYHRVTVRESLASLRARNALPPLNTLHTPLTGISAGGDDVYEGIDDVSDHAPSESIRPYAVDSYSDLYSEFVDDWTVHCPADSLSALSLSSTTPTNHMRVRLRANPVRMTSPEEVLKRASYHGVSAGVSTGVSAGVPTSVPTGVPTGVPCPSATLLAEMRNFRHMDSDVDISEHNTPHAARRYMLHRVIQQQDAAGGPQVLSPRHLVMTPLMERSVEGSLFEVDSSEYEKLPGSNESAERTSLIVTSSRNSSSSAGASRSSRISENNVL